MPTYGLYLSTLVHEFIGIYVRKLSNETDKKTEYQSIMVAHRSDYPIEELEKDIEELFTCKDKLAQLKVIVPEFNHQHNI